MRQVLVSDSNRQAVASSKLLRGVLPPPDKVNGPVRMIEIEGVDINACGGYGLPYWLSFRLISHKLCQACNCQWLLNTQASSTILGVPMRELSVRTRGYCSFVECQSAENALTCRTHLHSAAEIQVSRVTSCCST